MGNSKSKEIKTKTTWKTFENAELLVHTINLNFHKLQINVIFNVVVDGSIISRDEKVLNAENIIPEKFIGEDKTKKFIEEGLVNNHDAVVEMAKKRIGVEKYTKKELNAEIKTCKKLAKINLYTDLKIHTMREVMHIAINNEGLKNIIKAM